MGSTSEEIIAAPARQTPSGGLDHMRALYNPPRRSNFTTVFPDLSRTRAWESGTVHVIPWSQTDLTNIRGLVTSATWNMLLIFLFPSASLSRFSSNCPALGTFWSLPTMKFCFLERAIARGLPQVHDVLTTS